MLIYDKIKSDIKKYMKEKDTDKVKELKIIIGELERNRDKSIDDITLIKVIQKRLSEMDEILNSHFQIDSYRQYYYDMMKFIRSYLPEKVTIDEIEKFVKTIDFSQLKNYKQAIGITKKHFQGKVIDMKDVNAVVENMAKK